MIDFDGIRKSQENWRSEVKDMFVPGIDPADLKVGQLLTISPNLQVNDRSYTDDVLKVLAVNSGHVQVKRMTGYAHDERAIILSLHEHHFYLADGFEVPTEKVTAA